MYISLHNRITPMKKIVITTFKTAEAAEGAVARLHQDLDIATDEISYVYRNPDGEVSEVDAKDVAGTTTAEGAVKGAKVGGTIGAVAGLAAVVGLVPVVGPVIAAGPIATALGLTGAVGTTVAGAVTGALAGGVIGALTNLGIGKEEAEKYEQAILAGDILIVVHTEKEDEVVSALEEEGSEEVRVYELVVA